MKIGIVGTGNVGSTTAFLLAIYRIADEIVMINKTAERAHVEACDISHALPTFSDCIVRDGEFSDLENTDIVILTCGQNRKTSDKSRLELLEDNIHIYCEIIPKIVKYAHQTIFVIVTNPVDVLSYVTLKLSNSPAEKIIGSGTILDSSRFATVLSQYLNIAQKHIHADVFGEHGNSQVPIWSGAKVFGESIEEFAKRSRIQFTEEIKLDLAQKTKFAADEIIAGKRATYYGIAGSIAVICKSIKNNSSTPINVSTLHKSFKKTGSIFLSTPAIVGSGGVSSLVDYRISNDEENALTKSGEVIADSTSVAEKFL